MRKDRRKDRQTKLIITFRYFTKASKILEASSKLRTFGFFVDALPASSWSRTGKYFFEGVRNIAAIHLFDLMHNDLAFAYVDLLSVAPETRMDGHPCYMALNEAETWSWILTWKRPVMIYPYFIVIGTVYDIELKCVSMFWW
jgi:hypothetical protein